MIAIEAALLFLGGIAMKSASPDPGGTQGHLSGLQAKITLPDGTVRMAKLDGLGCTSSICSRVAIKGEANDGSRARFWLDSIATIKDIREDDALLVLKNGTEQRMKLITDFRVLYLGNRPSDPERLDLTRIKSLEFLPTK
jgi:hypothetical protein